MSHLPMLQSHPSIGCPGAGPFHHQYPSPPRRSRCQRWESGPSPLHRRNRRCGHLHCLWHCGHPLRRRPQQPHSVLFHQRDQYRDQLDRNDNRPRLIQELYDLPTSPNTSFVLAPRLIPSPTNQVASILVTTTVDDHAPIFPIDAWTTTNARSSPSHQRMRKSRPIPSDDWQCREYHCDVPMTTTTAAGTVSFLDLLQKTRDRKQHQRAGSRSNSNDL